MPRASVGVGPARVSFGSGCCVALVVPILIVGLLVGLFVGLSSAATPSTSHARKAVANELERTYKISSEKSDVHCFRLTTTRYQCSWEGIGYVTLHTSCAFPHGTAKVTFYKYGIEVNITFSGHYKECTFPE
jgi:hypothetical protein